MDHLNSYAYAQCARIGSYAYALCTYQLLMQMLSVLIKAMSIRISLQIFSITFKVSKKAKILINLY